MSQKSIHLKNITDFRTAYRLLKRHGLLETTPIILSEGDSWFSTPVSMNLLDQLVFPTPEDERAGRTLFGKGGLFCRKEKSGDKALNMFSAKKVKRLTSWINSDLFKFDLVLISSGGNDFVGKFLKKEFEDQQEMTVEQAVNHVIQTEQYQKVYDAYKRLLIKVESNIPVIAHTYDYPQLMGQEGELTVANIGLIAYFKKKVGDWISKNIKHSVREEVDQKEFAKQLIDNFVSRVLEPLAYEHDNFSFIDLRNTLQDKQLWHDEMHPNADGFHKLAQKFKQPILEKLPPQKRH